MLEQQCLLTGALDACIGPRSPRPPVLSPSDRANPWLTSLKRYDKMHFHYTYCIPWDNKILPEVTRVRGPCMPSVSCVHTACAYHFFSRFSSQSSSQRSKLTYAAPAWWGFSTSADRQRIETFLRRAARSGLWGSATTAEELGIRNSHRVPEIGKLIYKIGLG